MNGLYIFLLCAPVLAQWFAVAASQGGHTTWQVFFCQNPGCAANVTCVYCNDELLHSHTPIADCSGHPPPSTVCQHDGRAFVSTDANADCEFEGISGYMKTEKCTVHSKICDFNRDMRMDNAKLGSIVGGVVCLVCLLVGLYLCFCKKRRCREQHQQPVSDSACDCTPRRDTKQ
ncbi:uncharacterized protein LOC123960414 isoform X2 [Micropterus dolomieu]|uniref:uncharacterized protein LOC123960414 isoform X2 n=1 Tax=Micropterus dolomieu TaxID=147949 RepID=UPI001E8DB6DB|nr:uncharacterized protein LOC123960414 isoform X2 [Micropterus dolomieu]